MKINHEKLKLSGLIVIAALLILQSRHQHQHYNIKFVPPEPIPKEVNASSSNLIEPTGTITGSIELPAKAGTNTASVCAVRQSNNALYCEKKITDTYSISVPTGSYTVFASMTENPYNISAYRAYYTNSDNHEPLVIQVDAGKTVAGISPNDWSNTGDEKLIALLNEQQKIRMHSLALARAKKAAEEAAKTETPEAPAPDNTQLDVGGVPDSEQQSIDSTKSTSNH